MINLIPNTEKKGKVKDFYFRLATVTFFMLGGALFAGSMALLPAYFIAKERNKIVIDKLEMQKKEVLTVLDEETDKLAKDLNTKLSLIESIKGKSYLVTEKVIAPLLSEDIPRIKIERIYFQNTSNGPVVSVYGVAISREDLLLFRQALEGNTAFRKVDLPVSSFVQGSNIKFLLNLEPA